MRSVSPKRAQQNAIYRKVKMLWRQLRIAVDGYLRCEFAGDGERCHNDASPHPHHLRGREGERLYDYRYFMAVCDNHHRLIEANRGDALRWGYLILRSAKINLDKLEKAD